MSGEKYRELKVRNKDSNAIPQTQMTSKEDRCKLINQGDWVWDWNVLTLPIAFRARISRVYQ
jgi:hypothetical protein